MLKLINISWSQVYGLGHKVYNAINSYVTSLDLQYARNPFKTPWGPNIYTTMSSIYTSSVSWRADRIKYETSVTSDGADWIARTWCS